MSSAHLSFHEEHAHGRRHSSAHAKHSSESEQETVLLARAMLEQSQAGPSPFVNSLAPAAIERGVTQLQQSYGNRQVGGFLQAALAVSHPQDRYEEEADQVARSVLRTSDPGSGHSTDAITPPSIQRITAACEEPGCPAEVKQRAVPDSQPSSTLKLEEQVAAGRQGGEPLPQSARALFEPRFGQDFEHVRVHTGSAAANSAHSINALAYTVGADIVFGHGQYSPDTGPGQRLLAHELTHVIQQGSAGTSPTAVQRCGPTPCGCSADERAAKSDGLVQPSLIPGGLIQREEERTQPPPDHTFWERWSSQMAQIKRLYREQRYGCWCGPGNVCKDDRDDMDACCHAHDDAYASAGVTSAESPGPGEVGMWSVEGFKRTMVADLKLVACTQATKFDLNFYGPTAALYREGVGLIFGTRALIAADAFAHGL